MDAYEIAKALLERFPGDEGDAFIKRQAAADTHVKLSDRDWFAIMAALIDLRDRRRDGRIVH